MYYEICMAYKPAFWRMVEDVLEVSDKLADGASVVFVCKQGKDRSVLLARAVMEFCGMPEEEAIQDTLWLTLCFAVYQVS